MKDFHFVLSVGRSHRAPVVMCFYPSCRFRTLSTIVAFNSNASLREGRRLAWFLRPVFAVYSFDRPSPLVSHHVVDERSTTWTVTYTVYERSLPSISSDIRSPMDRVDRVGGSLRLPRLQSHETFGWGTASTCSFIRQSHHAKNHPSLGDPIRSLN